MWRGTYFNLLKIMRINKIASEWNDFREKEGHIKLAQPWNGRIREWSNVR